MYTSIYWKCNMALISFTHCHSSCYMKKMLELIAFIVAWLDTVPNMLLCTAYLWHMLPIFLSTIHSSHNTHSKHSLQKNCITGLYYIISLNPKIRSWKNDVENASKVFKLSECRNSHSYSCMWIELIRSTGATSIINLEINLPECVEDHCKQNKFS